MPLADPKRPAVGNAVLTVIAVLLLAVAASRFFLCGTKPAMDETVTVTATRWRLSRLLAPMPPSASSQVTIKETGSTSPS